MGLKGLNNMKTILIKGFIMVALMFSVSLCFTKLFLIDYVDYIETQRQQIAFVSILIQRSENEELRKSAPDMVARMIQKSEYFWKELQKEFHSFSELVAFSCLLLFWLLGERTIHIYKRWPFLRKEPCCRNKSRLHLVSRICGAVALSVICYCAIIFVSDFLLDNQLYSQMSCHTESDVLIRLEQFLLAYDQMLAYSKWLNVAYCFLALSVVFTASVLVLLKIDCSDFFKSRGCDDNGNPCPPNNGAENPPIGDRSKCCKD